MTQVVEGHQALGADPTSGYALEVGHHLSLKEVHSPPHLILEVQSSLPFFTPNGAQELDYWNSPLHTYTPIIICMRL